MSVKTIIEIGGALLEMGAAAKDLKDKFDDDFGKAEVEVSATPEQLTIVWRGTTFALDHNADFSGTSGEEVTSPQGNRSFNNYWEWRMRVFEDAGTGSDAVTISGTVKHVWQPHDTDRPVTDPPLPFDMIVQSDNANRVPVPGSTDTFELEMSGNDIGKRSGHPVNHSDVITVEKFRATIDSLDDFTSYTFTLTVRHEPQPVSDRATSSGTDGVPPPADGISTD